MVEWGAAPNRPDDFEGHTPLIEILSAWELFENEYPGEAFDPDGLAVELIEVLLEVTARSIC